MAKGRNFSAAFKVKVALEALAGGSAVAELAAWHKVHPNLITNWKSQASERMVRVFSGKVKRRDGSHEAEIKELHAKIGGLTVERDFLSKAFGRRATAGGLR